MTTAPERPITVDDIPHPYWCRLDTCEVNSQPMGMAGEGLHHSQGTMWPSRADDAENTVQLIHSDDIDRAGVNHSHTRLLLSIKQTDMLREDGTEYRASTWLDPDDARMLAASLTRYAEMAVRDTNDIRTTAADIRSWAP